MPGNFGGHISYGETTFRATQIDLVIPFAIIGLFRRRRKKQFANHRLIESLKSHSRVFEIRSLTGYCVSDMCQNDKLRDTAAPNIEKKTQEVERGEEVRKKERGIK